MNPSRRQMLKLGGMALAMIPVVAVAARNESARTAFKYKDTPEGDKKCSNCNLFVPGPTPTANGGCKVFPGDDEVAPEAYCVAWVEIPS